MSKLTKRDCVAIFGREWAESEGIHKIDMEKPASTEQQKLAEWVTNATKPKTEARPDRSRSVSGFRHLI